LFFKPDGLEKAGDGLKARIHGWFFCLSALPGMGHVIWFFVLKLETIFSK